MYRASSISAAVSAPTILVSAGVAEGAVGGLSHVHPGSGRVRALSGGEVDADSPPVQLDAVAPFPGFAGVDEVLVGDESESATAAGHPVADQSDVANAAVARKHRLDVPLRCRGIQIEHSQTFVFRRRFVTTEPGPPRRASRGRSRCAASS